MPRTRCRSCSTPGRTSLKTRCLASNLSQGSLPGSQEPLKRPARWPESTLPGQMSRAWRQPGSQVLLPVWPLLAWLLVLQRLVWRLQAWPQVSQQQVWRLQVWPQVWQQLAWRRFLQQLASRRQWQAWRLVSQRQS